jgi:hypothetical protein
VSWATSPVRAGSRPPSCSIGGRDAAARHATRGRVHRDLRTALRAELASGAVAPSHQALAGRRGHVPRRPTTSSAWGRTALAARLYTTYEPGCDRQQRHSGDGHRGPGALRPASSRPTDAWSRVRRRQVPDERPENRDDGVPACEPRSSCGAMIGMGSSTGSNRSEFGGPSASTQQRTRSRLPAGHSGCVARPACAGGSVSPSHRARSSGVSLVDVASTAENLLLGGSTSAAHEGLPAGKRGANRAIVCPQDGHKAEHSSEAARRIRNAAADELIRTAGFVSITPPGGCRPDATVAAAPAHDRPRAREALRDHSREQRRPSGSEIEGSTVVAAEADDPTRRTAPDVGRGPDARDRRTQHLPAIARRYPRQLAPRVGTGRAAAAAPEARHRDRHRRPLPSARARQRAGRIVVHQPARDPAPR